MVIRLGVMDMYKLFNSLPIESHTLIILSVIFLGIYAILDLEKKKPGHPYKYVIFCLIPTLISILINKYIYKFSFSPFWMKTTDIVSMMFIVICFIVLIFSTYLTYKKGYMSEEKKRILVSTIIPCMIGIVICILIIFITE